MPVFFDQMNREVLISETPQRIVSLVPSQTELLFDLGLEDRIVGVTKFCIHPKQKCKTKTVIGGTKNFRFETIDKLNPDLILGNKEENYQEGIEKLAAKYPVWMSDIFSVADALEMIGSVGTITGTSEKSSEIRTKIQQGFEKLKNSENRQLMRVLYLIWKEPYMAVGKKTFIDEVLQKCFFENVLELDRYPTLELNEISNLKPDLIFLSSEPFPFKEKHKAPFQAVCPTAETHIVDGEMFSWYGSRLVQAVDYLIELNNKLGNKNSN